MFAAVYRALRALAKVPGTYSSIPIETLEWLPGLPSFSRPGAFWAAVRIVTGFAPSDVLHCRLIEPGVETLKRVSCGARSSAGR